MNSGVRARAAGAWGGWLDLLFWHAVHAPRLLGTLRRVILAMAWRYSPALRRGPTANAARLLGPGSTTRDVERLARAMVGRFLDAIVEMGANQALSREELVARLVAVEGESRYRAIRAQRRGAILATAHLGSFETAMAMLAGVERRVHVVFSRDRSARFERIRAGQHARLGVVEAPVEDGLPVWLRLRDALAADEVVLMQADRTLPGQPGSPVPFLSGHLRVPVGPVKLARLTGAPLFPVFAVAEGRERVRIVIEEPVDVGEAAARGRPDPALHRLTAVIEQHVRRYPEQWMCLQPALIEDQPAPVEGNTG